MRKIHDSDDTYIQLNVKLIPSGAEISQILKLAAESPQN